MATGKTHKKLVKRLGIYFQRYARGQTRQTHIHDTYNTRCYFNVRSKADMSQLNLPHGTDN